MRKVLLVTTIAGLCITLSGCGSYTQEMIEAEIEKQKADQELLYEEFKADKAQKRLDEELSK
jgi:uncharacterized protein YceK